MLQAEDFAIYSYSSLTLWVTSSTGHPGPILTSNTLLQCQETSVTLGTSPKLLSTCPANSSLTASDTPDSSWLIGVG